MSNLPWTAWERFLIWLVIGLTIYFSYGRHKSSLHRGPSEQIDADIKI